ncbi:uncharacterized protein LOC143468787 [Clavelina lepadiformis]|uniref:Uncharacterized protein n=1 Tax=Clavelina lepadiformis TaxID=159417 RepID=A0ABP0F1D8_CLALP
MEVDNTSNAKSAIKQVKKLYATIAEITEDLRNHEALSSEAETTYINMMIEIKDLKQNCIDLTSYTMFLDHFVKPVDKWIQEAETSAQIKELNALAAAEEDRLKASQAEETEVINNITKLVNEIDQVQVVSWEEASAEIERKKEKCEQLAQKLKSRLAPFGDGCRNKSDAEKLIIQQRKLIREKNDEIFNAEATMNGFVTLEKQVFDTLHLMEESLQSEIKSLVEQDKDTDVIKNLEEWSGIKLISDGIDGTVMEVFYNKPNNIQKLSIEVKLKYNNNTTSSGQRQISSVSIQNAPVPIDDLVEVAVKLNDFGVVIPELQYRLSQDMPDV